jgi:hypothetical protein
MTIHDDLMPDDVTDDEAYMLSERAAVMASDEQDHVEEDPTYHEHYFGRSEFFDYDPVEMGFYDDDPNPYHGDYSEM